MRFRYLRIALLTSAFAANAFANTAETDADVAASRTTSSPTFVRDNSAASAVTATHGPTSVDDEDRARMTINAFAQIIGRAPRSPLLLSFKKNFFASFIESKMTLKAVYDGLGLSDLDGNILSNDRWIAWAYLVCKVGHHFEEDKYKFIMTTMSAIYDAEALFKILVIGIYHEDSRPLAKNLASVSNDHVKRLFFQHLPVIAIDLFHQEQHTAEIIYATSRGRIFAFLEKHVKHDMLPEKELHIFTSYLSVLLNQKNGVGTALSVSRMCSEDASLLQTLLSLHNFHDQTCLDNLVSIWLDVSIPPSKIVAMLVQDIAKADQYTVLFSSGSSRSFWVRYLEMYNELIKDIGNITPATEFQQLWTILLLHDVEVPKSTTVSKYLAKSVILKVLLSPEITNVIPSQKYLEEMTSNWLRQGLPPSAVVFMLVHEEAKENYFNILFTNDASSKFWMDYTNAFYATFPIQRDHMMSTLGFVLGYEQLERILEAASKVEATSEQAESLLTQYNRWLHA